MRSKAALDRADHRVDVFRRRLGDEPPRAELQRAGLVGYTVDLLGRTGVRPGELKRLDRLLGHLEQGRPLANWPIGAGRRWVHEG